MGLAHAAHDPLRPVRGTSAADGEGALGDCRRGLVVRRCLARRRAGVDEDSQPAATTMPPTVVTATGRPEEVSRIAGTIQIIPQERIAHSTAKSVTDLLAENAVGFMSEWTAGQTSINIRGASTEGQGRDFRARCWC